MTTEIRHLVYETQTRRGIYAAGTEVYVLAAARGRTRVCVDPDMTHPPGGRCHSITLPNRMLTTREAARAEAIAKRRADLGSWGRGAAA